LMRREDHMGLDGHEGPYRPWFPYVRAGLVVLTILAYVAWG